MLRTVMSKAMLRTSILSATITILSLLTQPLLAQDPCTAELPLCQRLKSRCVVAPYCPKAAPCAPSYCVQVNCVPYCKKPDVDCGEVCFEWCTSIYCKKCEPCYPGDPCERQVWHTPPCQPCAIVKSEERREIPLVARRVAF